jgi:hypothetical protein
MGFVQGFVERFGPLRLSIAFVEGFVERFGPLRLSDVLCPGHPRPLGDNRCLYPALNPRTSGPFATTVVTKHLDICRSRYREMSGLLSYGWGIKLWVFVKLSGLSYSKVFLQSVCLTPCYHLFA